MTGDTGDVDAVDTREVHGCQRLTVDLRIGDEDTLGYQRLILLLEVDVDLWTNECHDGLVVGLGTYHQHLVAYVEYGVAVGDGEFAIVYDT